MSKGTVKLSCNSAIKKNRRRNAKKVEAADKEWLYMYAENISVWQNIIEFRGPLVPRTV